MKKKNILDIFNKNKKVVFLSPHIDDSIIGAGGALSLLCEQGCEVYHLCFSFSKKSIPSGFSKNITKEEFFKAAKIMGLQTKNLIFYEHETRCFDQVRQNILEDLYRFNKEINPDMVFIPSTYDLHQDHAVICQEATRIFKTKTILGYEMPRNNLNFSADCFVQLDQRHLKKKMDAWRCFESQIIKKPMNYIEHLALLRGDQIEKEYAEAFEVIRVLFNGH